MTIWDYPVCTIVKIIDGDSVKVDMDLGQQIWVRERSVRLAGIAAREIREPGGSEARDHLRELLPLGTIVHVRSTGWDKYGSRIQGWIYHSGLTNVPVQQILTDTGWAVAWDGNGPQPKPLWPRPEAPK